MKRLLYRLTVSLLLCGLSCESYDVKAVPSPDGIIGFEGDDYSNAIQHTSDGGYIIAGYTNSTRKNYDMFVVKTRSDLVTEWSKSIGGSGFDRANSVIETSDRGFLVLGTVQMKPGNYDMYVVKLDRSGVRVWAKNYGGDGLEEGRKILEAGRDQYLIVGNTGSFGAGAGDMLLIRIDAEGDTIWQRTMGTSFDEHAQGGVLLRDGNFVITGYVRSGITEAFLQKVDADGHPVWFRTYTGCNRNEGFAVLEVPDGDLVMSGRSSILCPPYFDFDAYFVRTDANGYVRWQRTFGRTRYDEMYSLQPTADNGFIAVGRSYRVSPKFVPNHQMYVVCINSLGDSLWTRAIGDAAPDEGNAIVSDGSGGFVIAGYTQNFGAQKSDILLVRIDDKGNYTIGN